MVYRGPCAPTINAVLLFISEIVLAGKLAFRKEVNINRTNNNRYKKLITR